MASSTAWYFSLTMLRLILKVGVSMPFSTVNCSGMTWMACTCTREERGAGQQQVRASASCKQIQRPAPLLACPATPHAGSVMQRQRQVFAVSRCHCCRHNGRNLPAQQHAHAPPPPHALEHATCLSPAFPFQPVKQPIYCLVAAQLRLPTLLAPLSLFPAPIPAQSRAASPPCPPPACSS